MILIKAIFDVESTVFERRVVKLLQRALLWTASSPDLPQ